MTQQQQCFVASSSRAWQFLLAWGALQLVWFLASVTSAQGQGTVNIEGACPASCGLNIRIASAKLRERADGIDAVVSWTITQPAPEIKLTGFAVTATVELKGVGKDEKTVGVKADERQTVVKLQSGGFNKDIKFSDIATFKVKVLARTEAVPSVNVTDIRSIKIIGEGRDSAVDVSWRVPDPLPCSASTFLVSVKAINEKGDRLEGEGQAAITARSIRVQLKGDLNKKGLRNPEATVKLLNSFVSCQLIQNIQPTLEPFSSGTGSNAPNPVVRLKPIAITSAGSRFDTTAAWDVIEDQGFKATKFDLKFEVLRANGEVAVVNQVAQGNERSFRGPQAQTGDRSITVAIKATFTNSNATTVLTLPSEDKQTKAFPTKPIPPPVAPTPQNIGLNVTNVKVSSKANVHSVVVTWQVNVPANITLTSFEISAQVAGNQAEPKRSVVVLSTQRTATINFTFAEAGNQVSSARVQVIANARRADGSTFQQTASRSSN